MDPHVCFPQVFPSLAGRFSTLGFVFQASLTASLSTSDDCLYLYFCWRKGKAAFYYPGLSFHLWPNTYPVILSSTLNPLPSSISLLRFFFRKLLQTSLSTILKTAKAKPKPCYSFKLLNQFYISFFAKGSKWIFTLKFVILLFSFSPGFLNLNLLSPNTQKLETLLTVSYQEAVHLFSLASSLNFLVCLYSFNNI